MPTGEARSPTTEPMLQDGTAEAAFAAQQDADAEALSDRYIEDAIEADRDRTAEAAADRDRERDIDRARDLDIERQVQRDVAFAGVAPAKPTAKPNKETWRDWLAEDAPEPTGLVTRDTLLDRLRNEGLGVGVYDLRNWQWAGIVPYGVSRWDPETRTTRAFYPPAMADIVRTLLARKADGHKLADLGPELRDQFRTLTSPRRVEAKDRAAITATETAAAAVRPPALPTALAPALAELARNHERAFGGAIVAAEVRLIDDRGRPLAVRFDLAPDAATG